MRSNSLVCSSISSVFAFNSNFRALFSACSCSGLPSGSEAYTNPFGIEASELPFGCKTCPDCILLTGKSSISSSVAGTLLRWPRLGFGSASYFFAYNIVRASDFLRTIVGLRFEFTGAIEILLLF